jgi:ABC-type sugar transport system ATPase subunit
MATVNLRSVTKNFGATQVIHGMDIDIADGEFMVLVGPSGCGKSTLLRMIAGLESISSGELMIGGRVVNDIPPKSRDIAMVFQNYALYPHMTVRENMGFSLKLSRVPKNRAAAMIARAADILDLSELLDRYPRQLSGGQRQRVAMGRAIVRDPAVFLFDEPLSNLDAALRVQMRVELAELHQRLSTTMIYVTHDQTEAMTLADKIAVVNRGRLEQVASPLDLYHRPRNLFVARFIGSPQMNFLPARVAATPNGADGDISLTLASGESLSLPARRGRLAIGEEVLLGIRPEALVPSQEGVIAGTVRLVEHLGGLTLLHLGRDRSDPLVVQTTGNDTSRVGDTIRLAPLAEGMHVFDAKSMRVGADAL